MDMRPPERLADGRLRPRQIFRDPTLERSYWQDGLVVVRLFDDEEIQALRRGFETLRPADDFDPRSLPSPRATYHCTFLDPDLSYRRASDALVRRLTDERLRALLPGFRNLTSNFYVKPPGVGRFELHQNWPTLEDLDDTTLTAWVPLHDTTLTNGTIQFARGSHHLFDYVEAASVVPFYHDYENRVIDTHLEPVTLRAGEVVIFDDSLLHWSDRNRSSLPRTSIQIELVPIDTPCVLWVLDFEDPSYFNLYSVDTEFFLNADISMLLAPTNRATPIRRAPNPNRTIDYGSFVDALDRQEELRSHRYALGAND